MKLAAAVTAAVTLSVALVSANAATPDRPLIVPWKQIGAIKLDDTLTKAKYIYGKPRKLQRMYLPAGTRYQGKRGIRATFAVPGGELQVGAINGRIKTLATTSSRYRTPTGLHVSSRIPRGACHRDSYGNCVYQWKSFYYANDCPWAWLAGNSTLQIALYMKQGAVRLIYFGDPDVMLLCF